MPSPFPGMDPYIEAQVNWQDFHNSLIVRICDALGDVLPDHYVARTDERVELVGFGEESWIKSDVAVARRPEGPAGPGMATTSAGIATIEPVTLPVRAVEFEEVRQTWLEVRSVPDYELITVVEVLSPSNKIGSSRAEYLAKRAMLHRRKINLVEIDLLLGGHRLPMKEPLPPGHYFAVVARAERLPMAEVYAWSIRQPLPPIPIPLRPPDADVPIDLGALATTVYDRGRYALTTRYDRPLPAEMPLHPDDRAWAEHRGAEAAR
jgi:hypothetical protein